MRITHGFSDSERTYVASLYWQAFRDKLGKVMSPEAKACAFLAENLDPEHALCARDEAGNILGVTGFKTPNGALVSGGLRSLQRHYGLFGGLWRGTLLGLLERDVDNDRFLLDGIFVAPEARGKGVGSALLNAIAEEARARGYSAVRLDVINTNPRARALYERHKFRPVHTERLGLLKAIFNFESATTMVCNLNEKALSDAQRVS